ncbi:L-ribulose-5-phosphate 3-epimerase UlaE [Rosistilla ulvae]|uniref:L-ribulose-5-phosphate 3-epimerase UlaE n=1 Tax=Rosistilla ulvae TaxID=1930277 RepID=A0A517M2K1_9BACT|nr:sugar phosphate isomerase/epimerase family protein [Rosistilla ulvae]QDS89096.1 L-ribulose-5-phosphate 3-epimerase UlaE [Rosistilla ulvae]
MLSGISYWSLPGGLEGTCSLTTALQLAKEQQFDALELAIAPEGAIHVQLTEGECESMREQCDASGIRVNTLASGMSWAFNPVSNDESVRSESIRLHSEAIRRAAWLGCEALLYVPGVVTSPISPAERVRYDHAMDRAKYAVESLLKIAEECRVSLCIENVWNGFLYSPLELRDFIDGVSSDWLGVYFDAGNLLGYQQHPPDWIQLLGSRIKRVHVKGYRDVFGFAGNYEFCELDEGDVPLEETIEALREIGYDGTVVAEMLPFQEGRLERTATTLNALLKAVVT